MLLDLNYEAKTLVSTENLTEAEWLDLRRQGIGGSDAAAILGISPYKIARDVYFEKMGRTPDYADMSNWVTLEVGKRLESLVAEIFSKKTGFRVWQEKKILQHPLYPFMIADIDYHFETPDGTTGILECKTGNIHTTDKWEDGAVPYHYEIQCRHYLAVKNCQTAYIACLFGNSENDFVYRRIDRDLHFEEAIIEQEQDFWENNIIKECEPDCLEKGDLVLESLKRYKASSISQNEVVFDSSFGSTFEQIVKMRTEKSSADKLSRDLESKIKTLYAQFALVLGNATSGRCVAADGSEYLISYKPSYRTAIKKEDLDRMKLNDAELYKKYATQTESRPFQVKKIKK